MFQWIRKTDLYDIFIGPYIRLTKRDPCKRCIVQACCNQVCEKFEDYYDKKTYGKFVTINDLMGPVRRNHKLARKHFHKNETIIMSIVEILFGFFTVGTLFIVFIYIPFIAP